MASLFQPSLTRATDRNGDVAGGAKMYFYDTDTLTLTTAYLDVDETIPAPNPLVADAYGKFDPAYIEDGKLYRVILFTSSEDEIIFDVDPVGADGSGSASSSFYTRTPYDYGALGGYSTLAAAQAGVDDTAAIQALLADWTLNPLIIPDFGARYWKISSGIKFLQNQLNTAAYAIGGMFVAAAGSTGNNLVSVELRYGTINGKLGAFGTGGTTYSSRGWLRGIVLENSTRVRIEAWEAQNFKRDGFTIHEDIVGENNIAAIVGPGRALNCGSAFGQASTLLTQDFTSVTRTGASGSIAQRTVFAMTASVPSEIRVGDIGFYNSEPYVITAISGSSLTVFPWVDSAASTGTFTYGHGAGLRVEGANTASCSFGMVEGFRCASLISCAGLYAGRFEGLQSQVSGVGLLIGNPVSSASWGAQIGWYHAESTAFDIIGTTTSPLRAKVANPSAMGTQTGETFDLLGQSLQIGPRLTDNTFSSTFSTLKGIEIGGVAGPLVGGLTGVTRGVSVSTLDLSNLPSERSKTQRRTTSTIRLKWFPHLDKALYNHNWVEAFLFGTGSGRGPTGTTTVSLDSADQAAGITINGGTSITIPGGTHPLHIRAIMDNSTSPGAWLVNWARLESL